MVKRILIVAGAILIVAVLIIGIYLSAFGTDIHFRW